MFRRVIAPVLAVTGAVIVVVGFILVGRGVSSFGIPIWAWQALGAGVFFTSMLAVVFEMQRQLEAEGKFLERTAQSLSQPPPVVENAPITERNESASPIRTPPTVEKEATELPSIASTPVAVKDAPTNTPIVEPRRGSMAFKLGVRNVEPPVEIAGTSAPAPAKDETATANGPSQAKASPVEAQSSKSGPAKLLSHKVMKSKTGTPASPVTDGGREFVDVATDFLKGFYKEHPAVESWKLAEGYVGKWMTVSGSVANLSGVSAPYYILSKDPANGVMYLYFDKKWSRQLLRLKIGTSFKAVGQIRDINANYVNLENCELRDD